MAPAPGGEGAIEQNAHIDAESSTSWRRVRAGNPARFAASAFLLAVVFLVALDLARRIDDDASGRDIDFGRNRCGERQQQRLAAPGRDLQEIAGTEIVDCDNGAERVA